VSEMEFGHMGLAALIHDAWHDIGS
jgi:hypothetical protein